jgi:hypothetical protein
MTVSLSDVVHISFSDEELHEYINVANKITTSVVDRNDLHSRDYLERFINVILGEISERMVIKWLREQGKYVESTVDKESETPDAGHDIKLRNNEGETIYCSIKSSLSVFKKIPEILEQFTIATTMREVRDVNIQVYFWLNVTGEGYRVTVPTTKNAAIIGWVGKKDLTEFTTYATEDRESPSIKLKDTRPLSDLLNFIS